MPQCLVQSKLAASAIHSLHGLVRVRAAARRLGGPERNRMSMQSVLASHVPAHAVCGRIATSGIAPGTAKAAAISSERTTICLSSLFSMGFPPPFGVFSFHG